jgi:hypothetical protein
VRAIAVVAAALSLHGAVPAQSVAYVQARQQPDGGFAERGGRSTPGLTAWSVLALKAAGGKPQRPIEAAAYLARQETPAATDVELTLLALAALGHEVRVLADRVEDLRKPDGRIGTLVNSTLWGVLALRAADRPAGPPTVAWIVRNQHRSGGWPWAPGGRPDTDDTAVAIQALRAAGMSPRSRPIVRGLAYLRRAQRLDGGFAQVAGGPSNAQSTAWAMQAFAAAGRDAGAEAQRYLTRLRRPDGSYRYSAGYTTTPLWVTAQVLPALSGKPFPLR